MIANLAFLFKKTGCAVLGDCQPVFNAIFSVLVMGVPAYMSAQSLDANLIPNGSFEERAWCPSIFTQNELKSLRHWKQPNAGTPDHFDACGPEGATGVPRNVFGDQHPVDGSGYAGLVLFSSSKPDYREYLQVELNRSLLAGEWICAEWWVCAADEARFITDGMGMYFSTLPPSAPGEGRLEVEPQVSNPLLHLLSDRWSWIRLSDVFQATGNESWLTIGNFHPAPELRVMERHDVSKNASQWAYVYIDDVRVRSVQDLSECSCLNPLHALEATDPPWQTYQRGHVRWDAVLFEFDSDAINDEAQRQLELVAEEMRSNHFLVMEVNGHTDLIGQEEYNLGLSERRAQMVIDALRERGVDPNRLKLARHGSEQPAADNATAKGRRRNRRVEFELLEHAFLPTQ